MALIIPNDKGFKVIRMNLPELMHVFGGFGICDHCGERHFDGIYVAVLNHWVCQECYDKWNATAENYPGS